MRGMIKRTFVASVAALALGGAAVPALAGGFVSGHSSVNLGTFQHMAPHPLGTQHLATQPLVRPGQVPPLVVNPVPPFNNRMSGFKFAHRHGFGFVPFAGFVPWGPLSEPVYVGTVEQPLPPPEVNDNAPRSGSGIGSVCQTETRTVPSEAGGQHTIHITRCWN